MEEAVVETDFAMFRFFVGMKDQSLLDCRNTFVEAHFNPEPLRQADWKNFSSDSSKDSPFITTSNFELSQLSNKPKRHSSLPPRLPPPTRSPNQ